MDAKSPGGMPSWLPFVLGGLLVVQFVGLSYWQLQRGLEKRAEREAFSGQTGFSSFVDGMDVRPYQRLRATGRFLAERQILLDNIIIESKNGHYVLTPFETAEGEPLLLVNRGWIARTTETVAPERLDVPDSRVIVHGRAGSLPRAGYRMGEPFHARSGWPRHAVYPTLEEVAAVVNRDLQPFVLLMDPGDEHGFVRHWAPAELGPGRHFGYALQWFAMAAVLAALLIWHFRRRPA